MTLPPRRSAFRRWHWLLLAAAVLVLDYLSGPYIQLPILFALPVGLATWRDGWRWGSATAVMLPLIRLAFSSPRRRRIRL